MKRTIITNESLFRNLNGYLNERERSTEPANINLNVDQDDDIAEFYLGHDWGRKLDMGKESAQFINYVINRLMAQNKIDLEKVTFGGSRDSVIYFMGTIIDQYLRYRRSESFRNRDDDFVF